MVSDDDRIDCHDDRSDGDRGGDGCDDGSGYSDVVTVVVIVHW